MRRRGVLRLLAVLGLAAAGTVAMGGAAHAQGGQTAFGRYIRQEAAKWPRVTVGREAGQCTWQKLAVQPDRSKHCGFVFRTPPDEPRDMFWSFVLPDGTSLSGWAILPMVPNVQYYMFRDFHYFDNAAFKGVDLPKKNRTFLQTLGGPVRRLQPDTEYILWVYLRAAGPGTAVDSPEHGQARQLGG